MRLEAREVVRALLGRWYGRSGLAKCPSHPDRTASLAVRDGERTVLLKCFAGCSSEAVIAELRRLGVWPERDHREARPDIDPAELERRRRQREAEHQAELARRIALARRIWRAASPAAGTAVEAYLRGRGITIPIPASLRYAFLEHHPSGTSWPTMVAAVQGPDGRVVAINRTFLALDGTAKAPIAPAKMALGPTAGAAVRLGPAGATLALAEGIETALSVMVARPDLPAWAAIGAANLAAVELPEVVREAILIADRDSSGTGERAARAAADRLLGEGRRVRIALPPEPGSDLNDLLRRTG